MSPRRARRAPAPAVGSRLLGRVAPYPFAELERRVEELSAAGRTVLNFGIGDPDLPPPQALVSAARSALGEPGTHQYSSARGEADLRAAVAEWMKLRFGVRVDPASEVAVLIGSKEGLVGLPRAILDPGERLAVPDPGYPAYHAAAVLARARAVPLPLDAARGYRPDWDAAPERVRLVYLNYPNNPTGAVARRADLHEAVERARDGGFVIAYDNAYSEMTFGPSPAPSLFEVPGARECGVEFHSLSKTFGVPGWRLWFAIGPAEVLRSLVKLKSQSESGAARPLQRAAIAALGMYRGRGRPPAIERRVREYGRRLDRLVRGLGELGWPAQMPGGGLYLWQAISGESGAAFAARLLERTGVLVTPGAAFGRAGAAYVRWSVTRPRSEIEAALGRLAALRGPDR